MWLLTVMTCCAAPCLAVPWCVPWCAVVCRGVVCRGVCRGVVWYAVPGVSKLLALPPLTSILLGTTISTSSCLFPAFFTSLTSAAMFVVRSHLMIERYQLKHSNAHSPTRLYSSLLSFTSASSSGAHNNPGTRGEIIGITVTNVLLCCFSTMIVRAG